MLTLLVLVISVTVTVVVFCRMNNVTFREAKLNVGFWVTTSILVFLIPWSSTRPSPFGWKALRRRIPILTMPGRPACGSCNARD